MLKIIFIILVIYTIYVNLSTLRALIDLSDDPYVFIASCVPIALEIIILGVVACALVQSFVHPGSIVL